MKHSIKKSISVNELEHIFQINDTSESDRANIKIRLFESTDSKNEFLLKSNIRTIDDIENELKKLLLEKLIYLRR